MTAYPWGETDPSQPTVNLPDTGSVDGKTPGLPRAGAAPTIRVGAHD